MDFTWAPYFTGVWIFPLLCLIFMVAMMVMMFRRGSACMPLGGSHRGRTANDGETPRQILDRRYASGQIGKEQYAAMRRDLNEPL
jgi:putative membrane protein